MGVLVRAAAYAAVFIGLVLVLLPARILEEAGITAPRNMGVLQVVGMLVTVVGASLVIWCILAFVFVGKGTPAIFDPPRHLVVRGPYRLVRNPMYLGAGLAVGGAALVYRSVALAGYAVLFLILTHAFVYLYEEPTLRRKFGDEYGTYCREVGRWLPTGRFRV